MSIILAYFGSLEKKPLFCEVFRKFQNLKNYKMTLFWVQSRALNFPEPIRKLTSFKVGQYYTQTS